MPINEVNGRTLTGVVAELKDEVKEFVSTRAAMLQAEMKDKLAAWKTAAPMIVVGVVLLGTAWLLLTGAIVAAIYVAFEGNPFAAAIALILLGVVYALAGGAAAFFAYRQIVEKGLKPERTLRVLKDDQLWIRNEARVQL